jgi:hypothetical protein
MISLRPLLEVTLSNKTVNPRKGTPMTLTTLEIKPKRIAVIFSQGHTVSTQISYQRYVLAAAAVVMQKRTVKRFES